MENKLTVFYRKLENNEIHTVCSGIQSYKLFYDLSEKEAETIYGRIVIDKIPFLLEHTEWFEIKENNDNVEVKIKEECKNNFINIINNL